MKKRRMLALALALALIMSLVPVSGLAAEPVGFMDPGAVMQEDTEESVNTEAVNGEEALSPDSRGRGRRIMAGSRRVRRRQRCRPGSGGDACRRG